MMILPRCLDFHPGTPKSHWDLYAEVTLMDFITTNPEVCLPFLHQKPTLSNRVLHTEPSVPLADGPKQQG